jgi:predicted ATP-grasp superfamily ATP-dependent carboligase
MMKYERLTDEKEHYKKCVGCSYRNCKYCEDKYEYAREVHKRLAELEDKIEQGTLIFKENEDENSRKE